MLKIIYNTNNPILGTVIYEIGYKIESYSTSDKYRLIEIKLIFHNNMDYICNMYSAPFNDLYSMEQYCISYMKKFFIRHDFKTDFNL